MPVHNASSALGADKSARFLARQDENPYRICASGAVEVACDRRRLLPPPKPGVWRHTGCAVLAALLLAEAAAAAPPAVRGNMIHLPPPRLDGPVSVERALHLRRSVRTFSGRPITLSDLSQLLWAAQGITGRDGRRAAPSAGALYPLELLVVAGNVKGLAPGVYRYGPAGQILAELAAGDRRAALAAAAFNQRWTGTAAAILVFCAVPQRTLRKYGARGMQYVYIETGHAAQNVFLQAESLGLGAAVVGAFDEARLAQVLGLAPPVAPVYLMPIGAPGHP